MIKINEIKNGVYRSNETSFVSINGDEQFVLNFTFNPHIFTVEQVKCNVEELSEEKINDILSIYGWIYDKSNNTIKFSDNSKEPDVVEPELIKYLIVEACSIDGAYTSMYDNECFSSSQDMNELLHQYNIESCFDETDCEEYDPELNV